MKLIFHGGAGRVTGSNYLLESGDTKILIDCGLRQGGNFAEVENFNPFPYDPKEITAVLITHAHVDHIGRVPKLFRDGFAGTVYSTAPTKDFSEFLLLDSEHLLSREAEKQGQPPLYDVDNVRKALENWKRVDYHKFIEVGPFRIEFYNAGHILGSAFIKIEAEGKSIIFSGDLGNSPAPIIPETENMPAADYCLVESTYGNRLHESTDERRAELEDAIEDTVKKGGTLMIPAFAMERTQDLLYHINALVEEGRIPKIRVFVDSPLAIRLTEVYGKYKDYFDQEAKELIHSGDDILNFKGLTLTLTTEESKAINEVPPPKVIIAGSGMSQGGRILHHEMRYLPDPNSMLLIVGYQTEGSLGRRLLSGEAKQIRIMGTDVPVNAEVRSIQAYSAHADQKLLMKWVKGGEKHLKKVFVVQGDGEPSRVLAEKIKNDLGLEAEVPEENQIVEL